MFRHGKPVTVVRSAGGFDSNGDPTAPTSVHVIEGCAWAPRTQGAGPSSGSLDLRGRQGVIEGLTLYAPYGSDITHTDQMILGHRATLATVGNYVLWAVEGEEGQWANPYTGREAGLEVAIRRSAG